MKPMSKKKLNGILATIISLCYTLVNFFYNFAINTIFAVLLPFNWIYIYSKDDSFTLFRFVSTFRNFTSTYNYQ